MDIWRKYQIKSTNVLCLHFLAKAGLNNVIHFEFPGGKSMVAEPHS